MKNVIHKKWNKHLINSVHYSLTWSGVTHSLWWMMLDTYCCVTDKFTNCMTLLYLCYNKLYHSTLSFNCNMWQKVTQAGFIMNINQAIIVSTAILDFNDHIFAPKMFSYLCAVFHTVVSSVSSAQRSAQEFPAVERQDLDRCSVLGGQQMVLTGQNFTSDSKVIFSEKTQGEEGLEGEEGFLCYR